MTSNYDNKFLLENADGAMGVDFKDFYSNALNQMPWKSQEMEICTPDSQVLLASSVECVADEERDPTIAIDKSSNAISSPPPSKRIRCSTKRSNTIESGMFY